MQNWLSSRLPSPFSKLPSSCVDCDTRDVRWTTSWHLRVLAPIAFSWHGTPDGAAACERVRLETNSLDVLNSTLACRNVTRFWTVKKATDYEPANQETWTVSEIPPGRNWDDCYKTQWNIETENERPNEDESVRLFAMPISLRPLLLFSFCCCLALTFEAVVASERMSLKKAANLPSFCCLFRVGRSQPFQSACAPWNGRN